MKIEALMKLWSLFLDPSLQNFPRWLLFSLLSGLKSLDIRSFYFKDKRLQDELRL